MKKLLSLVLAGTGLCLAQNPVVRLSYVTPFSAVSATGTQTSSAIRIPNLSGYGTLTVTGSGITGSPSGCQIALEYQQSAGGPASAAFATQSFTPANSYQSFAITPSAGFSSGDMLIAVYSCSAYPSAGTLTATFDPSVPVNVLGTVPVSGTFWQATQPVSLASLPALASGSNTVGAVTQSGTWTVQPGNTANTTPWLATINQGGNSATVTAGNALKVDGSGVTQPVSGTFWQATQPVSAASLPLPSGAAQDATVSGLEVAQGSTTSGQNGALVQGATTTSAPAYTTGKTNPLSLTTGGLLRVDASGASVPVTGTFWQATQPVSGTVTTSPPANASTNITQWAGNALGATSNYGTSPGAVAVPGVNAYVTNTPAVSQSGTWNVGLNAGTNAIGSVQLTDGTNTANVIASDSGQNAQVTARGRKEVSFSTTTAQAVASTDVSNYSWVSVHVTSQGTSSALAFQGSNDNTNWDTVALMPVHSNTGNALASISSSSIIMAGPLSFRYFRLNVTGITAGTTAGVIEFFTETPAWEPWGTVALSAGSSLVGEVAPMTTATTTDATSTCYLSSAASTNSTNCKASAGNVYGIYVVNTTSTNYFLRMYNASSAPTCSSATGFVETVPALGAASNGAGITRMQVAQGYSTGIGFCLTGGGANNDNTNAATGVYVTILYK